MQQRQKRQTHERRREIILEAARKEFQEAGFGGARIQRISAEAAVSSALIYRHFESKEDLFYAAVLEPFAEVITQFSIQAQRSAQATGRRRWVDGVETHERMFSAMTEVLPLLGAVLFSGRELAEEFYQSRLAPLVETGTKSAAESIAPWARDGVDPALLFRMIYGTYLALAIDERFGGETYDRAAVAESFVDLLVNGLTPQ